MSRLQLEDPGESAWGLGLGQAPGSATGRKEGNSRPEVMVCASDLASRVEPSLDLTGVLALEGRGTTTLEGRGTTTSGPLWGAAYVLGLFPGTKRWESG